MPSTADQAENDRERSAGPATPQAALVTATCDHDEVKGESSLPFAQFAARLYVFHYDRHQLGDPSAVADRVVADVIDQIGESWGSAFDRAGAEAALPQGEHP